MVEAALLIGHAALFFVAPFLLMGVWQAVVFVLVTQTAFGFYLGASFVTNHVGMPVLSATDDLDYLRRQVLTSRNLAARAVTGFVVGGLDAQIEHHLFPSMPRANLPGPGRWSGRSVTTSRSATPRPAPGGPTGTSSPTCWTTGAPLRIPTTV